MTIKEEVQVKHSSDDLLNEILLQSINYSVAIRSNSKKFSVKEAICEGMSAMEKMQKLESQNNDIWR